MGEKQYRIVSEGETTTCLFSFMLKEKVLVSSSMVSFSFA